MGRVSFHFLRLQPVRGLSRTDPPPSRALPSGTAGHFCGSPRRNTPKAGSSSSPVPALADTGPQLPAPPGTHVIPNYETKRSETIWHCPASCHSPHNFPSPRWSRGLRTDVGAVVAVFWVLASVRRLALPDAHVVSKAPTKGLALAAHGLNETHLLAIARLLTHVLKVPSVLRPQLCTVSATPHRRGPLLATETIDHPLRRQRLQTPSHL